MRIAVVGTGGVGGGFGAALAKAGADVTFIARGAHLHCEAPEHRLSAPTRKLMTVRFAMAAAQRINRLVDPQGHSEF